MFVLNDNIYKPSDIDYLLKENENITFIKSNKKIKYANTPFAFDIETTSFYNDNQEKCACMYAWVFGINGKCIIGRTWEEFLLILNKLSEFYELDKDTKRLIIWVHNLSYEFQFLCKSLNLENVFALSEREVCYCLTTNGIEFRCSYILSGYSLAKVGEHLLKYKVKKMVGDLDYKLLRHYDTPLTEKEQRYILNDALVVMAYVQELIENNNNNITTLPLTKTGFVRKYTKTMCLYGGNKSHRKDNKHSYLEYRSIIEKLIITDAKEYAQLKRAFCGGFTHASWLKSNNVYNNVASFDFTSSYPSVMCCEKYPMGIGKLVKIKSPEHFEMLLNNYCCLFDITFSNLTSKIIYEHPLSYSKCYVHKNVEVDNGRIISGELISTTVTELDYKIFKRFYNWDNITIHNMRVYDKLYLPKSFILSILKLYNDKTQLKGVIGKEVEYLASKEQVNATYGMCVTDICRDNIIYKNGEWLSEPVDIDETIAKYNAKKGRFLSYQWGVWVTAYARYNLFSGIYAMGNDYIYSDTDSLKVLNYQEHTNYINAYNENIKNKLLNMCKFYNIDSNLVHPKTIKGVEKWLGIWDFEGVYDKFKTLGAKRYLYYQDNHYNLTVSGLNKKIVVPYLESKYNNLFDAFKDGLYIPKGYTGKNIHTYIDYEQTNMLTDYLGTTRRVHELSSIHMEESDYSLSLTNDYINLISGIREKLL